VMTEGAEMTEEAAVAETEEAVAAVVETVAAAVAVEEGIKRIEKSANLQICKGPIRKKMIIRVEECIGTLAH
jgi:hypothetical protein